MAEVRISADQFAQYVRKLGLGGFAKAMRKGVVSGAQRTIPLLVKRTQTAPPASPNGHPGAFDTGRLTAGWKSEAVDNGARVTNSVPYAPVVEGGRRPHGVSQAGQQQLAGWAKRKLGLTDEQAKSAAFLIARKLKTRALQPRQMMSGALDEMTNIVLKEVAAELGKELERG